MLEVMRETRALIAANIRARLAWAGITDKQVMERLGWPRRTSYNKLHGITAITAEELQVLAEAFDISIDALFEAPPNFPSLSSPSVSSKTPIAA